MEDVSIFLMDLSIRGNVGISINRALNPVGLERYTDQAAFNIAEDADLLEWSVPDDLLAKYDRCTTSQHVAVRIANYEAAAKTSTERVPLITDR